MVLFEIFVFVNSFENGVGNRGDESSDVGSVLNESSKLNSNVGFIASTSVIDRDRLASSESNKCRVYNIPYIIKRSRIRC